MKNADNGATTTPTVMQQILGKRRRSRKNKSKAKSEKRHMKKKLMRKMQPASNLTKDYVSISANVAAQTSKASAQISAAAANAASKMKVKVLMVRDQLNFYLGDSNLSKDKFLRQKLAEATQLPLTLFLTFNRVKRLLADQGDDALGVLRQAVQKSSMLKLSKCGKLVKRRLPFDLKSVDRQKVDKSTVYVENFPDKLTIEEIAKIFSRAGEVRNITLPKFGKNEAAMETDASSAASNLSKGFCFIEFDSQESAAKAVLTLDKQVPEELTNAGHKNYVGECGNVTQLSVMTKATW